MNNVKPPLKSGCPPLITFTQCWHLQLFSERTLILQQNQSHQIDEGAHGEHFRPKISPKKLLTHPLNPKISLGDLGTSPSFLPVKERLLAVTPRMSPCTDVIHLGCTSSASLSLHLSNSVARQQGNILRFPAMQYDVNFCRKH